jgi:formate dehydrogenase iron-sulfur subunit
MKKHAGERIADLKSRGYENAGLYDPEGVGGTHVMYVLHHADKPHIYSNLPDHPVISPVVLAWKGVTKTAGLAAMGFAAAVAVVHGLFARANRVSAEDDENAKRLLRGDAGRGSP